MLKFLSKIFPRKEILPEVLTALRWKMPSRLNVEISQSRDGGYIAVVKNLPGCITQGDNGQELFEMVNDAIYTYLDIPSQYIPYLSYYLPSEELREKMKIKIPENILHQNLVLERI